MSEKRLMARDDRVVDPARDAVMAFDAVIKARRDVIGLDPSVEQMTSTAQIYAAGCKALGSAQWRNLMANDAAARSAFMALRQGGLSAKPYVATTDAQRQARAERFPNGDMRSRG